MPLASNVRRSELSVTWVPPAAVGAIPIIRECEAIKSRKHLLAVELKMLERRTPSCAFCTCRLLAVELKMLERRTEASVRKARAFKALAKPVAPRRAASSARVEFSAADAISLSDTVSIFPLSRQADEFRPTKIFSFFSWGKIR
jgi:hypothetical protein